MLHREKVLEFMKKNFISLLVFIIFGLVLNYNCSPLVTILALIIISTYSYIAKIMFNALCPKNLFLNKQYEIDTNISKDSNISNYKNIINIIIEILCNISIFCIFYIIKNAFKLKFISNILIFYFAVFYIIKQLYSNKSLVDHFHNFPTLLFSFLLTYFTFKPNDLINYKYILTIFIGYAILFLLYKILK